LTTARKPDNFKVIGVKGQGHMSFLVFFVCLRDFTRTVSSIQIVLCSEQHSEMPGLLCLFDCHQSVCVVCTTADGSEMQQVPRFIFDTSKYWHKPYITREEGTAINYCRNRTSQVI